MSGIFVAKARPVEATQEGVPVMSFPALLRNPGLTARYAHLLPTSESSRKAGSKKRHADSSSDRKDITGKRRIRRSENARFTSNPHVVQPTSRDYSLRHGAPSSTFPSPLPRYLQNSQTPTTHLPPLPDPSSSKAGQFTLALKGVRKELRRSGPRAERLVKDVEDALLSWLGTGDVFLFAASGLAAKNGSPTGDAFKNDGPIRELERNPGRLVWSIPEDSFARYICHCVCRWHNVVSYSKAEGPDDAAPRLTYILRPNPTRMNGGAPLHMSALDTPPATELDSASSLGFDSSQETDYAWSEEHSDYPPSDADDGSEDLVDASEGENSEGFVDAGALANNIPDLSASASLPPITQETPRRNAAPSSAAPHEGDAEESDPSKFRTPLPIRALNNLSINDEEDFASLAVLAQDDTPRPNAAQAQAQAQRRSRLAIRSPARRSNSHSSSPSRSPSSAMRWRATLPPAASRGSRMGSALPARLAPQGGVKTEKKPKGSVDQNQREDGATRTLWSFVYE